MTESVSRWADEHQYDAEPQPNATADGVKPSVSLLWMTPDPLGAMAAAANIYKGKVSRSLAEVTDDERRQMLEDVQKTHLKAPLEVIKFHFLLEGVDRAFTHQHVRQRTAVYFQESMRFAVLGDLLDATTLPPSLADSERSPEDYSLMPTGLSEEQRAVWDQTIRTIDQAYHFLVENGVPAEEARGLLPHATATRIHYVTDLRNLSDHSGNRFCTQAQFHWREVFAMIMQSIQDYTPDFSWANGEIDVSMDWKQNFRWQHEAIAQSGLFRPACYQLGHCPFEASFDRSCTIRERVEIRAKHGGIDSSQWGKDFLYYKDGEEGLGVGLFRSEGIHVSEWLLNPAAARKR